MCFLLAIYGSLATLAQEPPSKANQIKKSSLFDQLPQKTACDKTELEKIRHQKKSQSISIKLSDALTLTGEILESLTTSAGVQNINVRLSNYGNALLHLSVRQGADKTNKITGRIIHPNHSDVLVISEENGHYFITKHKLEHFMVE